MSAYCNTCGTSIFPGGAPICGNCRDMVKRMQKQAFKPVQSQPQRIYVQQPVYYPVPYTQPQAQPYVYSNSQGYVQEAPQFSHFSGYGAPPSLDSIPDTRTFHWAYFLCCGFWLILTVGIACPLVFLGLIWRPTRVLMAAAAGYW